jgi:hypothetical protein
MFSTLPLNRAPWSLQESAQLDRIKAALGPYDSLVFDSSHTDELDPWGVVHDRNDAVLVHIARIDRRYIVVWPGKSESMRTATIAVAVEAVLASTFASPSRNTG